MSEMDPLLWSVDRPAGRLSDFEVDDPDSICRRCIPRRSS